MFFEEVIRENLDLGRPDEVQLIFDRKIRRNTPGRFRTRVVTEGVTLSLNLYHKNTRIKQYHKEGRVLRTEATIHNAWDFRVGKRLHNLPRLREIGFPANRRLLEVERVTHDCILADETFRTLNGPVEVNGQRASASASPAPKCRRYRTPWCCSGSRRRNSATPTCPVARPL